MEQTTTDRGLYGTFTVMQVHPWSCTPVHEGPCIYSIGPTLQPVLHPPIHLQPNIHSMLSLLGLSLWYLKSILMYLIGWLVRWGRRSKWLLATSILPLTQIPRSPMKATYWFLITSWRSSNTFISKLSHVLSLDATSAYQMHLTGIPLFGTNIIHCLTPKYWVLSPVVQTLSN